MLFSLIRIQCPFFRGRAGFSGGPPVFLFVALFVGGCAGTPEKAETGVISTAKNEYILTSNHRIMLGDLYNPSRGFLEKNIFTELSTTECNQARFMRPDEPASFYRKMDRSAAVDFSVARGFAVQAELSRVKSAALTVASGVRRGFDFQKFGQCVQELPEGLQGMIRLLTRQDGGVVYEIISGSYTVKYATNETGKAGVPKVATASGTLTGEDVKTGVGDVVFFAAPLTPSTLSLSVTPRKTEFHGEDVVKQINVQEIGGVETGWHMIKPEDPAGFIILPWKGALKTDGVEKLFVIRPLNVLGREMRFIMTDESGGAVFDITADMPKISLRAYAGYRPVQDDPPALERLVNGLRAFYSGRFQEADDAFKEAARMEPDLTKESSFLELCSTVKDYLHRTPEEVRALGMVYEYITGGDMPVSIYGDSLPDDAIRQIMNDRTLYTRILGDKVISSALSQDPALRRAFGVSY